MHLCNSTRIKMVQNISNQKKLFDIDNEIIYLNCANMSPLLKSVKDAGIKGLESRAKPWKLTAKDFFENAEILRRYAGEIFQTSEDNIAIIPSASYGLATAAKNLKVTAGKAVLILENQFPSNFYVWDNLATQLDLKIIIVKRQDRKGLTHCILECINSETGIVAIPNCHWMDGALIDLERISEAVKAVNAFLVLDLSQSLGALPINIGKIDPDFAVSVGYKWLLGPYGLGYMYVSPRWHGKGEPLEYSWQTRKGSDDFTSITSYTSDYRKGARKFDMGEYSQFNTIHMAIAALKQILEWDVKNIQSSLKALTQIVSDNCSINKTNQFVLTPTAGHIISIPIGDKDSSHIKKKLSDNKIVISYRGTFIRVSPYLYNDTSDIESLVRCLQ
jgi:selenocysteine lyase/cysteine desulfurase